MRFNTELTVHLGRLSENFQELKKIAPNNEIIFMVKANAYGHGILEIVFHAFYVLKVNRFGCASLGEAMEIRKAFPKMNCEIWVFSDSNLNASMAKELYLDYNIVPVIHNKEDLEIILEDKDYKNLPLVLKFDTGMNRVGFNPDDVSWIVKRLKLSARSSILHLMTHFANSYLKLKPNDKTNKQYLKFQEIKALFKSESIDVKETSCSNSGAIEQSFGLEESHIRPGLMLFGPKSVNSQPGWSGKSISNFTTEVIKIMPIKKGTPIGYGSHVCGHDGYIVYLPVGYGDGILTYYSGNEFISYGKKAKIIGRVNMDMTAIFFLELPKDLAVGKCFSFWNGETNGVSELAAQFKTTPYQLFTAISTRVPRRYIK